MKAFNMRKKSSVLMLVIIFIISTVFPWISSCSFRTLERAEETREMMGTYVTVIIYSDLENSQRIIDAAFDRIQEISDIASIYDEASQMSELNRTGIIEDPSGELLELINLSKEYYNITGGSFDITISPVLRLWREGLWKESEAVQEEKINEALELVGSDMINIGNSSIAFTIPGMSADLGGIAKGYAVDEALEVISSLGVGSALVNAGGDVGALGRRADGKKWLVDLDDPDDFDGENISIKTLPSFEFEDMAVATSGNYYRYYDPEKEVHHITDPATGYSANKCISATVIAESCTEADVLATAVFVKGPVEGLQLVENMESVEALVIDIDGNIYQSSGLLEYIK
jgi:thiamine biosynthesis lipoprotein